MNIFKTRIEPGGRFMSSEWDLHCSRDLPFGQRRNKRQGGEWDYNRIAEGNHYGPPTNGSVVII